MKVEPRGKYAGVKVHLDGDEAAIFLDILAKAKITNGPPLAVPAINFALKLGKKIKELQDEHPNLLTERSEEEITEALKRDAKKIAKQLEAIAKGVDWKQVTA